ncbi:MULTISPECIES: hypothetical protein, partial [unclassified Bradyrhizobium]|uniref:hypothetical protein n=1 Tax=unclassified Bradyrhizobium TaxID=2631580 RepID=UPI001FFAC5CC
MSQVAKSASAFVRALLAILALELEDSKREADTLASEFVSAKPIPLLQNSNERAKEASGLDGGFGWDWTA